jgi:DNA-binding transcriptional LysR family regulator
MEPTPRAEALRNNVRDILVRVEATVTAQPEFLPAQANRLFRLFVSDYTMTTLMPHLFALAYAQAPGIRFELRPQVAYPHRLLERGEADILIIPKEYCSTEHPAEVLLEETFCCVVWDRSPLAHGEMTNERYMAAGHVVVQVGEGQTALEDWFMQRLGIVRRVEASTYSFLSPAYLLAGTDRIATMHRRLAEAASRSLPIVLRDVPVAVPTMEQSVQWHKHRTSDPGLTWLRGLLKEAVVEMDKARRDAR